MILSDEYTLFVVGYAIGAAVTFVGCWIADRFKTPPGDTP